MHRVFAKISRRRENLGQGLLIGALAVALGCALFYLARPRPAPSRSDWGEADAIPHWRSVPELPVEIAIFETVFWEPADTESLRALIAEGSLARGKTVLEIGTGSGLLALCCLQAGAEHVVATDVNPHAVANAGFNARRLGLADRLDVRQVPQDNPGAWAVVGERERFDLILSNPPWEDRQPAALAEHALYDPDFALLSSLLAGLRDHLNPGGRALLAYGSREAIEKLHALAEEHRLEVKTLDDRDLDSLPESFLPGMLLEVTPK